MRAEVQHGVGVEDLLHVRVVRSEAMMRRCTLAEEKAHRISLVPEGRLDTDEDVAQLLAKHEEVLSVAVQVARRGTPVFLEVLRIRTQALVLLHRHAMLHV